MMQRRIDGLREQGMEGLGDYMGSEGRRTERKRHCTVWQPQSQGRGLIT